MVDVAEPAVRVPTTRRGRARERDPGIDGPRLPAPPELTERGAQASPAMHATFKALNGSMTIPLLRAGLGPWLGSPLGGWLLLLRVRGRKSGLIRDIPLSYLVAEGSAWVMAGFGPGTQWYRNLLADPDVEVILPGRTRRCIGENVRDPDTRRRILPELLRATGAPGFMSGCDPWHASVDEMLEVTASVPLIKLCPVGEPLVAGPDDPGGLGWVWRQLIVLGLTAWAVRLAMRLVRRLVARS